MLFQILIKPLHAAPDRINPILTFLEAVALIGLVVSIDGFAVLLE